LGTGSDGFEVNTCGERVADPYERALGLAFVIVGQLWPAKEVSPQKLLLLSTLHSTRTFTRCFRFAPFPFYVKTTQQIHPANPFKARRKYQFPKITVPFRQNPVRRKHTVIHTAPCCIFDQNYLRIAIAIVAIVI